MTTSTARAEITPDALGLLVSKGEAERALTAALACFQEQVRPIHSLELAAVVEAAKPAFSQGLAFSAQLLQHHGRRKLRVTVMHTSGAEVVSEEWADDLESPQQTAGWMLAMLLGIPMASKAQAVEAEEANEIRLTSASRLPLAETASEAVLALAQPQSSEPVESTAMEPSAATLDPLATEEIAAIHRQILALPAGARRELTQSFREHFAVPRSARSIGDRITQRRHAAFIEQFLQELELTASDDFQERDAA